MFRKRNEGEKKVKILIRNNKTDKHYKIEMGGKVKVGDKIMRLNEHEYLYNGKFEYCEVVKILEPKEEKKVSKPKITVCGINEEEVKHFPKGAIFSEYAVDELTEKDRKRLLLCYPRRYRRAYLNKWLKEEKKVKVMSHEKFRKLPYLDVKIVKVEQPIPEKPGLYCRIGSRVYKVYERIGKNPYLKEFKKNKSNWINGENLDKIKFPCFCSYNLDSGKCYGEINRNYNEHKEKPEYELSDITEQAYNEKAGHTFSVRYSSFSLKDLIKLHDIHILKGRIVLFEED